MLEGSTVKPYFQRMVSVAIDLDKNGLINLREELKSIYQQDFPIFACSITEIEQLNELKYF